MKKRVILLAIISLLICATTYAVPIDPLNTRPVDIGSPYNNQSSVQQILDENWGSGVVNALTGQSSAGMWSVSSALFPSTVPTLIYEGSTNAAFNEAGIWSGTDTTSLTVVPIFKGAAIPGTAATLSWDNSGNLTISGDSTKIYTGTVTGINPFSFGFYLYSYFEDDNFFTVDQLNGGLAQALAYNKPNTDTWKIFFDDRYNDDPVNNPRDFNDFVFRAESMEPIPEPATMLLLGSGLLGIGVYARRRFSKR